MNRLLQNICRIAFILLILGCVLFFGYCNNASLANPVTNTWYATLKQKLRASNYSPRLLIVCTRRLPMHNQLLVWLNGAAPKSHHLKNEAIDFLVFDVNNDGRSNVEDVHIVYKILDKEIVQNKGGIGTYLHDGGFLNRQLIHIDCRGYKARWTR